MFRRLPGLVLLCVLLGVGSLFFLQLRPPPAADAPGPPAASVASPAPGVGPQPELQEDRPAAREPPLHPLAVSFGSAATPPEQEPAILLQVLDAYRRIQGAYPTGEDNAAVMRLLTAQGPAGLKVFPTDHPRINAEGALTDAWGTAFYFHHLSSQAIEIRSAGPDRELYTADDLVTPQRPPPPVDPRALPARQAGPAAAP